MPTPQLPPGTHIPTAKTLNAHLALKNHVNDENTPPISLYTQYSSYPLHTSSPPLSPPSTFTPPISPPPPFFPRLEPHTPTLAALDTIYNSTSHPILDGYRMVSAGGVGNPYDEGKRERREREEGVEVDGVESEMRTKDAVRVLENHIRDRIPFAQLASRRMQAAMGVRNEIAFDLPDVRRVPGRYQVESNILDAGSAARAAARNNHLVPERRRDSALAFNAHSPLNSPQVDRETGKGLREWLLSKGKEFGMRKRECRSISFHDFSPDMRNNSWSNKLLGHFAVVEGRGGRERVDYYEVDLPTTTIDPHTGAPIATIETWVWFLISRPVVSIDASNTSTHPSAESPTVESTPKYYTPATHLTSTTASPTHGPDLALTIEQQTQPPPNFTAPIPTSWLVFACPLANTTSYPETTENIPSTSTVQTGRPKPKLPSTNSNGKKLHKRKDFDISHNGLPIFEFNTPSLFNGSQPPFLSVEGIGPWFPGDEYAELSSGEYREAMQKWLEVDEDGEGECENGRGMPSPYQGHWWKIFYRGVGEDARRWEEVRGAMGRGKCRVVVRWVEFEFEDVEMDLDVEGGVGCVGAGGGGKKIKERLVGRQGRLTRSEVRKRSQLGLGESTSGVAIGIGGAMGESARSRAVGNRELKRGSGGKK